MNLWKILNAFAWIGCVLFAILITLDFIRVELGRFKSKNK